MIANFNALPLCACPLSPEEAIRLEAYLRPLLQYLGAPGDWGYQSKLGRLTQVLHALRAEIVQAGNEAAR